MTTRTYFKINRTQLGQDELVIVVDGLMPIPPPGSRVTITKSEEGVQDAEVISSRVDIRDRPAMYEQTIFCNARR